MEVCGGQTHSIIRNGIDQLLDGAVEFIHGPGCPVCVTPLEMIDRALEIAARDDVIFCSFGDMLRVPGSRQDLFSVRARGGDVRIVYSPLDATRVAAENPDKEVVFFGVGFETTAPANAMSVLHAQRLGLTNFSVLVSHVLVPPAMTAILTSPTNRVQGFLAAGHVCTVMGTSEYGPLVEKFGVPIVVTGFEPLDLLEGVRQVVDLLESGKAELRNAYPRAVSDAGNTVAQQALADVFAVTDRQWRGIGMIPQSGWTLSPRYAEFDAELQVRGRPSAGAGVGGMPRRRGVAGPAQAQPVPGVRQDLHAAHPVGRHHGVQRGRVCGLLPVPQAGSRRRCRRRHRARGDVDPIDASIRRTGCVRCRCARPSASCSATAVAASCPRN